MRILLVEDDFLLGDGIRAGLRQQGFQVDWVCDGEAAQSEAARVASTTVRSRGPRSGLAAPGRRADGRARVRSHQVDDDADAVIGQRVAAGRA